MTDTPGTSAMTNVAAVQGTVALPVGLGDAGIAGSGDNTYANSPWSGTGIASGSDSRPAVVVANLYDANMMSDMSMASYGVMDWPMTMGVDMTNAVGMGVDSSGWAQTMNSASAASTAVLFPGQTSEQWFEGVIKSFNEARGWGFISCDETRALYGKDVFLTRSAMRGVRLSKGDRVHFTVMMSDRGPQAWDISLVPGTDWESQEPSTGVSAGSLFGVQPFGVGDYLGTASATSASSDGGAFGGEPASSRVVTAAGALGALGSGAAGGLSASAPEFVPRVAAFRVGSVPEFLPGAAAFGVTTVREFVPGSTAFHVSGTWMGQQAEAVVAPLGEACLPTGSDSSRAVVGQTASADDTLASGASSSDTRRAAPVVESAGGSAPSPSPAFARHAGAVESAGVLSAAAAAAPRAVAQSRNGASTVRAGMEFTRSRAQAVVAPLEGTYQPKISDRSRSVADPTAPVDVSTTSDSADTGGASGASSSSDTVHAAFVVEAANGSTPSASPALASASREVSGAFESPAVVSASAAAAAAAVSVPSGENGSHAVAQRRNGASRARAGMESTLSPASWAYVSGIDVDTGGASSSSAMAAAPVVEDPLFADGPLWGDVARQRRGIHGGPMRFPRCRTANCSYLSHGGLFYLGHCCESCRLGGEHGDDCHRIIADANNSVIRGRRIPCRTVGCRLLGHSIASYVGYCCAGCAFDLPHGHSLNCEGVPQPPPLPQAGGETPPPPPPYHGYGERLRSQHA